MLFSEVDCDRARANETAEDTPRGIVGVFSCSAKLVAFMAIVVGCLAIAHMWIPHFPPEAMIALTVAFLALVGIALILYRRARGDYGWMMTWLSRAHFNFERTLSPLGCLLALPVVCVGGFGMYHLHQRGHDAAGALAFFAVGAIVVLIVLKPLYPLHAAAAKGEVERLRSAPGAVSEARDSLERTPLHLAAAFGESSTVSWLLEQGADANATAAGGWTPLHFAAMYGHAETIATLVSAGADVVRQADDGTTALHWAARGGFLTCVDELLEAAADPNVPDAKGRVPLELAVRRGNSVVAARLRRFARDE